MRAIAHAHATTPPHNVRHQVGCTRPCATFQRRHPASAHSYSHRYDSRSTVGAVGAVVGCDSCSKNNDVCGRYLTKLRPQTARTISAVALTCLRSMNCGRSIVYLHAYLGGARRDESREERRREERRESNGTVTQCVTCHCHGRAPPRAGSSARSTEWGAVQFMRARRFAVAWRCLPW